MALFGRGKSGGVMNVIRCDLPEYLVWKWRPEGQEANSTTRENSIRYGSSLRVKDGEVAVFVYRQKDGTMQDYIMGPYDDTVKTANFPVLSSIVGLAFGGESPFQAEIYFINLSRNIQVKFAMPYFDVVDPRFTDIGAPVAVAGSITFNIADYREFIKLNRLINFELSTFSRQIADAVQRRVKAAVTNVPSDLNLPLFQIERKIEEINDHVEKKLRADLEGDFGINLKRLDISRITVDKESEGWQQLRKNTADVTSRTLQAQADINLKNLADTQAMNAANLEETLRIQREEMQRAQRLQSETTYFGAHSLDTQADVMKAAAANLAKAGMSTGGSGSMNPGGMMAGMAVGGALGGQMASMMNQMGATMNQAQAAPVNMPPLPGAAPSMPEKPEWMMASGGQQFGPYTLSQLRRFAAQRQFTPDTYVWRQGMAAWDFAKNVPETAAVFAPPAPAAPPVPPTVPPVPPTV